MDGGQKERDRMSTSVSWPPIGGTTYSIPASGELNWQALSTFLIALGNTAQSTANTKYAIRVATTTPVTVASNTDCVVVTNLAVAGAVAVNLPAGVTGQVFFVVDGKGDAASNNITIDGNGAEQINGANTYVISRNRAGVLLGFNGTSWTVLAEYTSVFPVNLASDVTGTLQIANGGTGQTAQTAAFDALAPTTTKGDIIASNGSDNIRVAVGSDGQVLSAASGQTSGLLWVSPLTNPMSAVGDLIRGGASGAATRLAGNTTTTKNFLTQTGDGADSAAPQWDTIDGADVPVVVPGTTSGVVSSSGLPGVNTNSNAGSGYVGEIITGSGTITATTSGYTTGLSIALTAGDWDLTAASRFTATASATSCTSGWSTDTNNNTGFAAGENFGEAIMSGTTNNVTCIVPTWRVSISGSTTYYLVVRTTGANCGSVSYGRARRVR